MRRMSGVLVSLMLVVTSSPGEDGTRPFTVIAIGDAGETGSELRACGTYINDMYTGRHDAGTFDAMLFLGDNFYKTGLNGPRDAAESKAGRILGRFGEALRGLGRANVHAIPGEHDYYARNLVETNLLFGLINKEEMPVGLNDVGNRREAELNEWIYHYHMPAEATYPVSPGSKDSVQFLFFDTALLLRTSPSTWSGALDSLRCLLMGSRQRTGLRWRIFCAHHPFSSAGEHGGYTSWNDETDSVEYLTPCDKDSNAASWLQNSLDPEDLCAGKYRDAMDSLRAVIHASGAPIQVALAAHDHSLQLLLHSPGINDPEFPGIQIISGAGSAPAMVKLPSPPAEFTSAQTDPRKQGESFPGFVQLQFGTDRIRVRFFNARSGDWLDMGGGRREFWIDSHGALVN